MKIIQKYLESAKLLLMAALLFVALLSSWLPGIASAYGTLNQRSIQLSSTANGANNTSYNVSFTTTTNNQTIGSVVIKFCANTPIIGDGCSAPNGFDTNYSTLSLATTGNITGLSIATGAGASNTNTVVLTRTAAAVANGAVTLTLGNGVTNGLTNPTTSNQTFYARIMTFASETPSLLAANETALSIDAGGIAMSTANQLNVTAKVQEALTFCVYTDVDCATGGTGVTLGDINGVLESTTTTYTSTAKFDISSNAVAGVAVRLKGDTLKSGTFNIAPYGATCTADSTSSGTEQFGIRMSVLGTGMTATAPYNCGAGLHAFDQTETTALYGHEIGQTLGATDVATSTIEFAAKSANTSEAGVYTTALTLIATAKY
ncbi:MAG TPA: hypothetical protein VF572_02910 [Candidatus Saccharimonadales bacterium]|jgi:hypothetical protein